MKGRTSALEHRQRVVERRFLLVAVRMHRFFEVGERVPGQGSWARLTIDDNGTAHWFLQQQEIMPSVQSERTSTQKLL